MRTWNMESGCKSTWNLNNFRAATNQSSSPPNEWIFLTNTIQHITMHSSFYWNKTILLLTLHSNDVVSEASSQFVQLETVELHTVQRFHLAMVHHPFLVQILTHLVIHYLFIIKNIQNWYINTKTKKTQQNIIK